MSKLNPKATPRPSRKSVAFQTSSKTADALTYEGAPGFSKDPKNELFLLAVSNFVGEDTFYEKAGDRDKRYADLVRMNAQTDPSWTASFLMWLRHEGNMRSASIVGAAEFVKARLDLGIDPVFMVAGEGWGSRRVVASVLLRPDEPGDLVAYWRDRYGLMPMPIKRGVNDAVRRMYTERNLLKYDTPSHGVRFGDVIELTHPKAGYAAQNDLFRHAIDRRHGYNTNPIPESLRMLRANADIRTPMGGFATLDPVKLAEAGMTWEDTLSYGGQLGLPKSLMWDAIIPEMGYMAILRNLRNFDDSDISMFSAEYVNRLLQDPGAVAKSRQFPFRFFSAYEALNTDRWRPALNQALALATTNIPDLPGSLVLIDTSASMTNQGFSAKSKVTPAKAAAVFGITLGIRSRAEVWGFADGQFQHKMAWVASPLREVERFMKRTGEVGHGTQIADAVKATFRPNIHKRVFIISDMQTMNSERVWNYSTLRSGDSRTVQDMVPADVPIYGFNLGGYAHGAYPLGPKRYEFGGLTDATFKMIPLIEAGENARWPWE
jgi:hypothetical protein